MSHATLIRAVESGPNTMVKTIKDPSAHTMGVSNNPNLTRLSEEVKAMGPVFEEANKARAEQRRLMDELHADLLLRIKNVKEYMTQEVKRLEATIASFKAKFEHELQALRNELMTKLNLKISQVRASIAKLNTRVEGLEGELKQEVLDRIRHIEEVLLPIQKDVGQLIVQLKDEVEIRHANEERSRVQLQESVDLLEKNIEIEKYNREQQYMDFKQLAEYERERILKRQYTIEKEMELKIARVDENVRLETDNRLMNQDGIVNNMTNFIKAFQENIKEDAKMG